MLLGRIRLRVRCFEMKNIFQSKPKNSFYTAGQIAIASLIGGSLAGAWLMRCNYQIFGEAGKARWAIVYWIVSFVITLASGILIFKSGFFIALPLSLCIASPAVFYYLVKIVQRKSLDKMIVMGAKKQSYWCVISIGLLSFMLIFCLCVMIEKVVPVSWLTSDPVVCFKQADGKEICLHDIVN